MSKEYLRIEFHAQTHYMQVESEDKNFIKGVVVSFSKFRYTDVIIQSDLWVDKSVSRKNIHDLDKEQFLIRFDQAVNILKQKINAN